MANKNSVEAKISVDIKDYKKGMQEASKVTEKENSTINKSFDKMEDNVEKDTSSIVKSNDKTGKSIKEMAGTVVSSGIEVETGFINMENASNIATENINKDIDKIKDANGTLVDSSSGATSSIQGDKEKIKESYSDIGKGAEEMAEKSKKSFEEVKKEAEKMAKTAKDVGDKMSKTFTAPIVAGATGIAVVGTSMQDAQNSIRIGTGAIGKDLDGLLDDFDKVNKKVPASTSDVALAIADINTKLGLTGKPLQAYSEQILNLCKITGEDLAGSIDSSSKMLNNWNVKTEDYGKTLDYVFKVSQSTGAGVGSLMQNVTQLSSTFREGGYSLEQSISLIGQLEKAGVSASTMVGAMDKAFLKLKSEGCTNMQQGLTDIFSKIKNTKSEAEATSIAMDYFGKSGIKMADALRNGRLDVDEFAKSISANGETIDGLAEETRTFADELKIMLKDVLMSIKPLGEDFIQILKDCTPAVKEFIGHIADMIGWFANLSPAGKAVIGGILAILACIGPLLSFLSSLALSILAVQVVLTPMTLTIGAVVLAIMALISAIAYVVLNFEEFKKGAIQCGEVIVGTFKYALDWVVLAIKVFVDTLIAVGKTLVEVLIMPFKMAWETITSLFKGGIEHIKLCIGLIVALFNGDFASVKDIAGDIVQNIFDTFKNTFKNVVNVVKNSIEKIKSFFDFEWSLPKLKVPKFTIEGNFSLNPISVPKIGVQWHAKGGIFTKPTLFNTNSGLHGVGEAGAEAILPLDKLPDLLGLNKESSKNIEFNFHDTQINGYNDIEQLSKELAILARRRTI